MKEKTEQRVCANCDCEAMCKYRAVPERMWFRRARQHKLHRTKNQTHKFRGTCDEAVRLVCTMSTTEHEENRYWSNSRLRRPRSPKRDQTAHVVTALVAAQDSTTQHGNIPTSTLSSDQQEGNTREAQADKAPRCATMSVQEPIATQSVDASMPHIMEGSWTVCILCLKGTSHGRHRGGRSAYASKVRSRAHGDAEC